MITLIMFNSGLYVSTQKRVERFQTVVLRNDNSWNILSRYSCMLENRSNIGLKT